MKKKVVAAFALLVILASCRKDRTCTCEVTTSGIVTTNTKNAAFPPFIPASENTMMDPYSNTSTVISEHKKVSKANMRGGCPVSEEEEIYSQETNTAPGSYTVTVTDRGTREMECEIK